MSKKAKPRVYATPRGDAILALLREEPATVLVLSQLLGVAKATINSALRGLKRKHKARITDWERQVHGRITAVWAAGRKPDCPQPTPYTSAERTKRYTERNKLLHIMQRRKQRGETPRVPIWLQGLAPDTIPAASSQQKAQS